MNCRYLKNVSTVKLNRDKCTGCKICTEVCPHHVFDMKESRADIADKDRCMECGACAQNCPSEAIEVNSGVGCAYAVIMGWVKGTEPSCDCSGSGGDCC